MTYRLPVLSLLSPSHSVHSPAHEGVLSTFRVGHPASMDPTEKILYRHPIAQPNLDIETAFMGDSTLCQVNNQLKHSTCLVRAKEKES